MYTSLAAAVVIAEERKDITANEDAEQINNIGATAATTTKNII